jgi:hypothetical protein
MISHRMVCPMFFPDFLDCQLLIVFLFFLLSSFHRNAAFHAAGIIHARADSDD